MNQEIMLENMAESIIHGKKNESVSLAKKAVSTNGPE